MADAIAVVGGARGGSGAAMCEVLYVTAGIAPVAGVTPREVEREYLAVYVDALEWVEMPNTLGMAVFADVGRMASKPYDASGGYINRMSDFCGGCACDIEQKTGPRAGPFNDFFRAFLIRHCPPGDMPSGG